MAVSVGKTQSQYNLITVTVRSKNKSFTASGTVIRKGEIRITDIDGYNFDLTPEPYMLVVRNQDKPGVIGRIGTFLGDAKVNIANMQVSRNQAGDAMMFMSVDNVLSGEVLTGLQKDALVKEARFVRL
ncbi:MAG: ACT domain-containing protein [Acidaminococcaceae bacterium]|nr:ACT domain-containing protein [Acidaminococcaceae bacterium]